MEPFVPADALRKKCPLMVVPQPAGQRFGAQVFGHHQPRFSLGGEAVQPGGEELVEGGEFTNEAYIGTLENDGTALSDFYAFEDGIPAELTAKLDELKAAIIAGTIDPLVTP